MSARKPLGFGSDADVAQLVERKLPKLESGYSREQTRGPEASLEPGRSSPLRLRGSSVASVRHRPVRDSFGLIAFIADNHPSLKGRI